MTLHRGGPAPHTFRGVFSSTKSPPAPRAAQAARQPRPLLQHTLNVRFSCAHASASRGTTLQALVRSAIHAARARAWPCCPASPRALRLQHRRTTARNTTPHATHLITRLPPALGQTKLRAPQYAAPQCNSQHHAAPHRANFNHTPQHAAPRHTTPRHAARHRTELRATPRDTTRRAVPSANRQQPVGNRQQPSTTR